MRRHCPNPGLALQTRELLKRFSQGWHITQYWVILEARVHTTRLRPQLKLTDIARLANVSVTTASYVLNGKAAQRRISPATVERACWRSPSSRVFSSTSRPPGSRRGQSRTPRFHRAGPENPSYARPAKLLEQRARQRGYQLLIAGTDDEPDTERRSFRCCARDAAMR